MTEDSNATIQLLGRWHAGASEALNELLERDLPWIRKKVHFRLGEGLRRKTESVDIVQDAMVEVLRYCPRFTMSSREQFRGLMAQIIENVLRGKHNWFEAQRRQLAREKPLPSDSVVNLDPPAEASVATPSLEASRSEREARVRIAIELLDADDREVLVLRQWKGMSFSEIGELLELSEDAARMRFHRTLPKLAMKMRCLESGDIDSLVEAPD